MIGMESRKAIRVPVIFSRKNDVSHLYIKTYVKNATGNGRRGSGRAVFPEENARERHQKMGVLSKNAYFYRLNSTSGTSRHPARLVYIHTCPE
jgi:hypothetical protein